MYIYIYIYFIYKPFVIEHLLSVEASSESEMAEISLCLSGLDVFSVFSLKPLNPVYWVFSVFIRFFGFYRCFRFFQKYNLSMKYYIFFINILLHKKI